VARVLHLVPRWLPPTERFVAEQIAGSRLPGVVVSRHRPLPGSARVRPTLSLAALRSDRAVALALPVLSVATRADLVHVHFGYRLRDARRLLGRRPVVVSLFGHDITGFARDWPRYYAGVLDRADAVVVPSRFLAGMALAAGADPDRVRIVPPGVDTGWFTPSPVPTGAPEVAFLGRFVEKKGLDVLLAAWPAVRRAVPEARLRLIGAGPLEPLARGAASVGVDVVVGTGREQVRTALHRATVVCSPSRTAADGDAESLLLVNLEAQACGRAVVTTRHAAVPEFVDEGTTALLVDEGAVGELAATLIDLLRDRDEIERLAAAGPSFAARFDLAVCARRMEEEVYGPALRG
jgi:colanic acid/amylovoran biosynthesis glycosyltransferase